MNTSEMAPVAPEMALDSSGPNLATLRAGLLDQVLWMVALALLVTHSVALYRLLITDGSLLVLPRLAAVVLIWLLVLARHRLSYRLKAALFLGCLWIIVGSSLVELGPVANSKSMIILLILLAMLFLPLITAWLHVAFGALFLGLLGAATVSGLLLFPLDYAAHVQRPEVWLQVVFSFVVYSGIIGYVTARLIYSLNDLVQALAAQTRALTDARAALQGALAQQQAIFQNSAAGIALIGPGRIFRMVNPRLAEMLGYDPAALIGQSTRLLYADDAGFESVQRRFYEPLREEAVHGDDVQLRRADGTLLWTHASLGSLHPAEPSRGLVLVLVDIEQHKRTEQALAAAKTEAESANRAKSRFLAAVSHDLRTPLHAILGFAEVLRDGEKNGARSRSDIDVEPSRQSARGTIAGARAWSGDLQRADELFDALERNGRGLLRLVDDVLEFSRVERGEEPLRAEDFELAGVLRRVLAGFETRAKAKGLALELVLDSKLPARVRMDRVKLERILANLLDNATKYTESGRVLVRAEVEVRSSAVGCTELDAEQSIDPGSTSNTDGGAEARSGVGGVDLHISVLDTGPGIAALDRTRIFELFERGSVQGVQGFGLGLSVSRRLAERLGGRIHLAQSPPGAGSCFSLVLPGVEILAGAERVVGHAAAPTQGVGPLPSPPMPTGETADLMPPPTAALDDLRQLADLGRTSAMECWCRRWGQAGYVELAERVSRLVLSFEHGQIIELVNAQLDRVAHPADQDND